MTKKEESMKKLKEAIAEMLLEHEYNPKELKTVIDFYILDVTKIPMVKNAVVEEKRG